MNIRSAMIAAAIVLAGAPANAATLAEEVTLLVEQHPRIKAARNNLSAADEGIDRAFAQYLPRLELFADYGYEHTDSPGLRAARDGRALSTPRETLTATLSETVFDGFRREAENETARLNRAIAELDLESTTQNVLFEGTRAYLNVLRRARLVQLAVRNEQTIQRQLNLEDERVARGAGIAVDVLQAKSRLQIAKERRVAFEGNLRSAISRYVQVFDRPPQVASMVLPEPPAALIPASLDEAEDVALAENPSLASSNRSIDVAAEQKRSAESGYYPEVDVVAQYNFEEDDEGVIGTRRDYSFKVQARWELFSGFATRADAANAAFQHLASMDNHAFVGRKVVEDVNLAWERLETARRRVELLKNAVNIAIEVHDARQKLRDAGRETALNVLDAENEVFNAQIDLADAEFDARIAAFRVLLAIGRMTPATLTMAAAESEVDVARDADSGD